MAHSGRGSGPVKTIAGLLGPRELIAITGGGGKTSLMFALARELCCRATVVTTTTTHIALPEPEESERLMLGAERWGEWQAALAETRHITVASSEENGKLRGFAPEIACEMYRRQLAPYIIVEADGAKRMPFKAYETYEPAVPRAATLQVVVIGIEPFLYPLSDENTFRLHLFAERRGIKSGEKISPQAIADILDDPGEYMKGTNPRTRRILLVNKCDLADEPHIAAVRDALRGRLRFYDVLLFASLKKNILCDLKNLRR